MDKIRVAVNGYGTVGKRVADAVRLQPDMDLIGVCDVLSNYQTKVAAALGVPLYAAAPEHERAMTAAGIVVLGTLDRLLSLVDVVLDCTPRGVGVRNLEHYQRAAVKAVFQGREQHDVAGHSFVSQANYAATLGRDYTRIASSNTISIARVLVALRDGGLLHKARGVVMHHPHDDSWQPLSDRPAPGSLPASKVRSNQTDELNLVLSGLDVVTFIARATPKQDNNHYWIIEADHAVTIEEVLTAFRASPRIALVRMADGINSYQDLQALMLDLGRPRGDMWETALWEDSLVVQRAEIYFSYQASEAAAIAENIDAIRALCASERLAEDSISRTDAALGMRHDFVSWVRAG